MLSILEQNKNYIEALVDYYINEASSYKNMALEYSEYVSSVDDATFGMIVGSVYSAFLQLYTDRKARPKLSELRELRSIINARSAQIKKAILESDTDVQEDQKQHDVSTDGVDVKNSNTDTENSTNNN